LLLVTVIEAKPCSELCFLNRLQCKFLLVRRMSNQWPVLRHSKFKAVIVAIHCVCHSTIRPVSAPRCVVSQSSVTSYCVNVKTIWEILQQFPKSIWCVFQTIRRNNLVLYSNYIWNGERKIKVKTFGVRLIDLFWFVN